MWGMALFFFKKDDRKNNFLYYWLVDSYTGISQKSHSKYIKYVLRFFKNWSVNYDWLNYINKTEQHKRWKNYSGCDFWSKVQYPYLSLKFDKNMQLIILKQHYDWVFKHFREDFYYNEIKLFSNIFTDMLEQESLVEVTVKFKSPFEYEGEMSMFMKVNGEIQYTLTFMYVLKDGIPSLFIGGLQAGKQNVTNLDGLKVLTKTMFGLRPKQFILQSLSVFSEQMNIDQIIAISNENHVFSKVQRRWSKKQIKTSLNSFWEEFDAKKTEQGNYIFKPLSSQIDIEAIASKKRSQYKKRQLILDDLMVQIEQNMAVIKQ